SVGNEHRRLSRAEVRNARVVAGSGGLCDDSDESRRLFTTVALALDAALDQGRRSWYVSTGSAKPARFCLPAGANASPPRTRASRRRKSTSVTAVLASAAVA